MGASVTGGFRILRPKRLCDSTVEQVLSLVRTGGLAPGTKLPPERSLVSSLGVSRNSLREAIRVLETMGVLRVEPGRGTWVREDVGEPPMDTASAWLPFHGRDVIDLLEMRDTLEIKAAALAAERGSNEHLEALVVALDRLKAAIDGGDSDEIIAADAEFHQVVAEASDNRLLADCLAGLDHLVDAARRALLTLPGRLRRMAREHEAVVAAILSRDPEASAAAMSGHVHRVAGEVEAAMSRERYVAADGALSGPSAHSRDGARG